MERTRTGSDERGADPQSTAHGIVLGIGFDFGGRDPGARVPCRRWDRSPDRSARFAGASGRCSESLARKTKSQVSQRRRTISMTATKAVTINFSARGNGTANGSGGRPARSAIRRAVHCRGAALLRPFSARSHRHVFFRRLRKFSRAATRTKMITLALVLDLRRGLRGLDGHSTNWIFSQIQFPLLHFFELAPCSGHRHANHPLTSAQPTAATLRGLHPALQVAAD